MKILQTVIFVLVVHMATTHPKKFGIGNILKSTKDIGTGIMNSGQSLLPTPTGLFESGKNLIAGYPLEFVSTSINAVCSAAVYAKSVKPQITPDIKKMQFQFRTPCKNYSYSLLQVEDVLKNSEFDTSKKTVILVTGWANETDTVSLMAKAYHCRGGFNFMAIDVASYIDTLYTWSAFNTEAIGEGLAKSLAQLCEHIPTENIHLIGHSLGAHIAGAAGRTFQILTGESLARITGLDPSKPCFNEGESLSGLLRGDAQFIDIIHSNSGVLGKRDPMGDADFYPGGLSPLPPGCNSVVCAHDRAWQYYIESVFPGNENNFMASRCSSLTRLRSNLCPGPKVPMGFAVPFNVKGSYFLDINGQAPFGKNASTKAHNECVQCLVKNIDATIEVSTNISTKNLDLNTENFSVDVKDVKNSETTENAFDINNKNLDVATVNISVTSVEVITERTNNADMNITHIEATIENSNINDIVE